MDWVLLRDGDGSGSDSDDGGSRARVPGGSDSASEDGSDSGFAIVRVRRSDRHAGAGVVSPADGVVSGAPAMVAVPRPAPPGLCFKVVSYGEAFSACSSFSSSTDAGSDFLDETTIREALFGAAACSRGAGEIDDGDRVTHEEDYESEVGEHDGAGSSVEASRTSSASGATVSPCKALPEVASGVEEEDAQSSGEEEDDEDSSGEEEDDEESSGEDDDDEECSEEEEDDDDEESSGEEDDTEISEDEEQDVDGESSNEVSSEILATRHTAIDADGKGEQQPAFPGRSYDDIDDSDDDPVPSSRICTTHNAVQAAGIEVPAPLFFWIDEDHQLDGTDTDTDMEEEGSSEPVRRDYDGIDDSCGMEESDCCGEECDEDDGMEGSEVEGSGTEDDDEVATDADVEYGHDAENQRPEFVRRSYDDIDSGSDMEEEVAADANVALPQVRLPRLPEFVRRNRSYDDIDSGSDMEEAAEDVPASSEAEDSCCNGVDAGRSYDGIDSGSDMEESGSSRVQRPLSEFFFQRAARALPQDRSPRLPEFVRRSYDDIDSDCGEEDGAASSEAEESCCEEEDDIDCSGEEEHSGDEGESDSEVAYDVKEDQPAAESRGGRKYDDIDTSDSETDEGDRDSTAGSDDDDDEEEEEEEEDAIPGVCGLCGHIVEIGTRPVDVGSITELYCCFDPEAVVRPARVVCKNGKAICIVYDDGERSAHNPRPGATATGRGGGAEEHVEPVRSMCEYDGIDTDTEDGGAQFTSQAGQKEELALEDLKRRAMAEAAPDVEDLLLEMLEELEPAQPKHARRVEAEPDAPPAAAHVQKEHAGQRTRSAGSPSDGLTLCAMVYLLVYLATGGFFFF